MKWECVFSRKTARNPSPQPEGNSTMARTFPRSPPAPESPPLSAEQAMNGSVGRMNREEQWTTWRNTYCPPGGTGGLKKEYITTVLWSLITGQRKNTHRRGPLGTISQGPKSNGSYGLCPTALYKHRRGTRETKAGASSGEWGCRGRHQTDGRDPIEWKAERFRDKEQKIGRQGRTGSVLPAGEIWALQSRYLAALTRPVDIGKVALEQCWC